MKEQFEKLGKISRHKKGIGMTDKKVLLIKIWVRFIIVSMYAKKHDYLWLGLNHSVVDVSQIIARKFCLTPFGKYFVVHN